jgi:hypothetical protein
MFARFDYITVKANFKHIKYRYHCTNAKNNYDKAKYAVLLADQYGTVIKCNLIECYVESAPRI